MGRREICKNRSHVFVVISTPILAAMSFNYQFSIQVEVLSMQLNI